MKIGILGSGIVAQSLAAGFLRHGHDVTLGTRTASKLADWKKQNPKANIAGFAETAKFGELVVLAVKGTVALEALRATGVANLAGKTVIDATNPIADAPPVSGVLKFFTSLDESLMERLVSGILDQFGWETADMGKAEAARAIEPLCILWCIPGFLRNDWSHAFKLLSGS